ncbi:hypothetical protein [Nocardioides sp. LS1]|uniref:hypothetical protein n=1 Tax=Nocardioides sp. LS1 TaxID=1027620 RepID=UPI000F619802|nr:hypothetical protein [Nocardioides sp. LS1]GCD91205.1 hypothetical protein NLS1_32110 [Nocardioides sp. LS1]
MAGEQLVADDQIELPSFEDPTPEEYNAFVEALSLGSVETHRVLAERVGPGESEEASFETRVGFMTGESSAHWRYDASVTIVDSEGTALGTIEVAIVVTATYEDAAVSPSPEVLARFGGTTAALIAHPYLRETIATAAQRIGFTGVTLPMLKL